MIGLLAKIGFKKAIQDYAYKSQSKTYKDRMEFAFVDSEGRKYFYFPNLNEHLPLCRLEVLNELQDNYRSKIPGTDLDLWITKVKQVLNSDSNTKVTDMGYYLGALEDRRTVLFDHKILMEIAALLYIREDENPGVYNRALHKEKYELFMKEAGEGASLYDFFQQAGLKDYIPSQSITRENWDEYLTEVTAKMERFNSAVTRITTLRSEVERIEKDLIEA